MNRDSMRNMRLSNTLFLFLALVLLTMLLGEMATYFLKINELLYKDLSEQLTLQQIEKILQTKTKWSWVGFAVLPLLLFLKISVIAWVLAIGGFFHDVELKHKHYFRTVLISEFVFLLPALLKIGWFYFFEMEYTLEEVQQFVPFSLMHLLGGEGVPDYIPCRSSMSLKLCTGFFWPFSSINIHNRKRECV